MRLHVEEAGSGDPVLLVHGWPQHSGVWERVAELLAPHRRLLMPDLRGFGRSPQPRGGYDVATFVGDLLEVLDERGIERAEVVGHDWGGYTCLRLAETAPQRVTRVLAISTPHLWLKPSLTLARGAWRSWYAAAIALPGTGRLVPRVLMSGASASTGMDPRWAKHMREPGKARTSTKLYRSYFRELGHRGRRDGPFPPVHMLIGSEEKAFPVEAAVGGDLPPFVTTEVLEGAGHWIPELHPEIVAERVLAD